MTPRPPASDIRIGPGSVPGEPPEPVYGHNCRCGAPAAHWHHIVSRSKLSGPYSVVEIDGMDWGNLVALCFGCHDAVEHVGRREDWADIVLPDKDSELPYIFHWFSYETGLYSPLGGKRRAASAAASLSSERAAPGGGGATAGSLLSTADEPAQQSPQASEGDGARGAGEDGLGSDDPAPRPGEKCPTCNRKVNHPRKDTSPVSSTISQRLPADEKDGMKTLIADTAATIGADELKYPQAKTVEVGMLLIGRHHDEALEIVREMAA